MAPKKKDVFADLDSDFKTSIENMSDAEIRARISEVAIAQHENLAAKKEDQDLAEKVAQVKLASEQYTEATKMNKLRISYAHTILQARGKL